MQRIRVLWIADTLAEDAGTERQIVELSRRLCSRFELHVVTFRHSEPRLPVHDVTFQGFPMEALWSPGGLVQVVRLASYIRSRKIQIVQGFMVKAAFAAALAGALAGAPVILTSRRNLGYHYTRRLLMLTRMTNRLVTRIVANSQVARAVTADYEGVDPDKIDVLYNGVDMDKFYPVHSASEPPAIPIPSGVPVVGIVANYRPVKDLELFLRSAALVARRVPDTCFLLAGSGSLEDSLRKLADELGISRQVIFTSGKGDVLPYLHRMSVGCLCSVSEGFSNSILEYMAVGLPVVATDVGGNGEAVQDGWTGFLVKERTPEAFAAPIIRLLEDEELRTQLGRNGLERCRREFQLSQAARRLGEYYEQLLGIPAANDEFAGQEELRTP